MIHSLQFAFELAFLLVILERDSRLLIQKLTTNSEDLSDINALIWEAKKFSKLFVVCQFNYIVRSGNKVAHAVAQDGLTRVEYCFWMGEALLLVVAFIDEDRRLLDPP
ncbi:hypothetical protein PVK06_019684 [Gossypium arboreum]|uniref:RNase H type-1 domain-containing protein n=1 Tax=Gossypium arboreum TaxID=29729 RepID=A0ABR0PKG1_GOSAR|nr:hypothetical protein PVK06_019684 [Gossypium arboreum]